GHDDDLVAATRQLHGDAVRAGQLAAAVDHHGARATDGRTTGAPEGQRVIDVVLDKDQTVEDGCLLGQVELVGLQVRGVIHLREEALHPQHTPHDRWDPLSAG